MKSNVDLTENRDFRTNEDDIENKWAIYQGNQQDRETKKQIHTFCDMITCDCCGCQIYPYFVNTICPKCAQRIEYRENLSKFFWLGRTRYE